MRIRRFVGLVLTLVTLVAITSVAAGAGAKDKLVGAGTRLNLAGQPVHIVVMAESGANGSSRTGSPARLKARDCQGTFLLLSVVPSLIVWMVCPNGTEAGCKTGWPKSGDVEKSAPAEAIRPIIFA